MDTEKRKGEGEGRETWIQRREKERVREEKREIWIDLREQEVRTETETVR